MFTIKGMPKSMPFCIKTPNIIEDSNNKIQ